MQATRRILLAGGWAAAAGVAFGGAALAKPAKTTLSPDQALAKLEAGNAAFVKAARAPQTDLSPARRQFLADGQAPFAILVSCADSRVAPEHIFQMGLGELFIVRNAGNTVDTTAMGTIEYGVAELGAPLIVVMGHASCGAVKAAMAVASDNATFPGAIDDMLEPIIPAVLEARGADGDATNNAIRQNVRRQVRALRSEGGPLIGPPQQAGKLKIVGAHYDLASGKVDFFDRG